MLITRSGLLLQLNRGLSCPFEYPYSCFPNEISNRIEVHQLQGSPGKITQRNDDPVGEGERRTRSVPLFHRKSPNWCLSQDLDQTIVILVMSTTTLVELGAGFRWGMLCMGQWPSSFPGSKISDWCSRCKLIVTITRQAVHHKVPASTERHSMWIALILSSAVSYHFATSSTPHPASYILHPALEVPFTTAQASP